MTFGKQIFDQIDLCEMDHGKPNVSHDSYYKILSSIKIPVN